MFNLYEERIIGFFGLQEFDIKFIDIVDFEGGFGIFILRLFKYLVIKFFKIEFCCWFCDDYYIIFVELC